MWMNFNKVFIMKKIVCLVGPSGVGKSSYARRLRRYLNLEQPVVVTTRSPRNDDSEQYRYVTEVIFKEMVEEGLFLEWDQYRGYFYGTLWESVKSLMESECNGIVLDLTPKSCIQVKLQFDEAIIIALLPDDELWLYRRLSERGTDNVREIKLRTELLSNFIKEVEELNIPTVYCEYDPTTWDKTFYKLVNIIETQSSK
jgi:guanylate kinase